MGKTSMKPREILEGLTESINLKLTESSHKERIKAFSEVLELINEYTTTLDEVDRIKLERDMRDFDIHHNSFEQLLQRGHVGYTTDYHFYLSEFSKGVVDAEYVLDKLSYEEKEQLLSDTFSPDFNEQMVALRHNFQYITAKTGHDGVDETNTVYEAKNNAYNHNSNQPLVPNLQFGAPSLKLHRKLKEGRPVIIANMTDKHKLLYEMRINCTNEFLALYKRNAKSGATSVKVGFNEFKKYIDSVTFVREDIEEFSMLHPTVMEYLVEVKNKQKAV